MSRTVLALVAAGAVIIAAALGYAWRVKIADPAAIHAVEPAPPAAAAATAPPAAVAPIAPGSAAGTAPTPGPVTVPSFDVARIGPDGRAVIAGRAAPGAKIVLLDGGKEIARGEADSRGEWVVLAQDTPLAPGPHELRVVQHIEGRAPVTSEQVVVAVVPQPPGTDKTAKPEETLVMISPSSGAATLVQPPSPAGVPKVGDLQVSTLDYDDRGQATITGQATPGATVRAYLDDKPVAEGKAGSDGRWRLSPGDPLQAGEHRLRVDRLAQDGKPVARLEMKFQRQENLPAENTRRLIIVRGDNLWNVARAHYGEGFRYTTIFEANKDLIRDPNLIYPGQTFTLPKVN
jgi:hypothetical protein